METYADREPVTTRTHDRPWTADLETDEHARNRQLVVAEAVDAIEATRPGQHVDLVTPEVHGHPSTFLSDAVRSLAVPHSLEDEGRCSCGGYVTRVSVRDSLD